MAAEAALSESALLALVEPAAANPELLLAPLHRLLVRARAPLRRWSRACVLFDGRRHTPCPQTPYRHHPIAAQIPDNGPRVEADAGAFGTFLKVATQCAPPLQVPSSRASGLSGGGGRAC